MRAPAYANTPAAVWMLCTAAIGPDNRRLSTGDVSRGNTYKGEAEMWKMEKDAGG